MQTFLYMFSDLGMELLDGILDVCITIRSSFRVWHLIMPLLGGWLFLLLAYGCIEGAYCSFNLYFSDNLEILSIFQVFTGLLFYLFLRIVSLGLLPIF